MAFEVLPQCTVAGCPEKAVALIETSTYGKRRRLAPCVDHFGATLNALARVIPRARVSFTEYRERSGSRSTARPPQED